MPPQPETRSPSRRRAVRHIDRTSPTASDRFSRAAEAFRRGSAVRIDGEHASFLTLAVETATDSALKAIRQPSEPLLLLTHARAQTLKIRLYTPEFVAVRPELPLSVAQMRAIADPTADLAEPMKGPFDTVRESLDRDFGAAIKLAKLAGLLPVALVWPLSRAARAVSVPASAILDYDNEAVRTLAIVTRARVPLEGAEKTELVAFRSGDGGPEHYAIVIGAPATDRPVLARLHSACFTGDLLGSLKCDCGAQLRGAIDIIARSGGGVLLYLAQEGRGIGLINKLRAYRLQDQGFDTIEANERLGFDPDERLYGIAARMLNLLGHKSVRLLTNNPDKVKALESEGIAVVERVQHAFPDNPHNRGYLKTKAEKAGHLF